MEETPVYDFRQYDRIWQRVAPGLEPYPLDPPENTQLTVQQESQLPGAEVNPCCMGTAAMDMIQVLEGFIEGELADQRYYMALARQAPVFARQRLGDLAAAEGAHARRLMAITYLITGERYQPRICQERLCIPSWCAALRERYHEEACGGMNYQRAADGTTDPCLSRLLTELGADEFRHADCLLAMLERSLRQNGSKC